MKAMLRNRTSLASHTLRKSTVVDDLLAQTQPSFEAFYVAEPKLVFADGQTFVDPKTGLKLFGPYGSSRGTERTIRIGVVGTGQSIGAFLAYLSRCESRIAAGFNSKGKPFDPVCFPDYPGNARESPLRCTFVSEKTHQRAVAEQQLDSALKNGTVSAKLRDVVAVVLPHIEALAELDTQPDVVVVVLPRNVEAECANVGGNFQKIRLTLTPVEKLKRKLERDSEKSNIPLLDLEFTEDSDSNSSATGYWNLHHAFKARAMQYEIGTQILWESTLDPAGKGQDPASIAWNLFTALYYKSGSIPWQPQRMPENTCFVGISFYRESPSASANIETSLAQVFGAGEGIVLKGSRAVLDKKRDRKPHLTESGAESLLKAAIASYTNSRNGVPPSRVVIHKSSRYWPEELIGLRRGLGNVGLHDFLALEFLGKRFMRPGEHAPLRGTVVQLQARNYLVFTQGYVPFFRIYPGMRIPHPLEVVEHHGDSTPQQIAEEVLCLTKLNWNNCSFAGGLPITLRFSQSVGKILAELPKDVVPKTKFKFYM
ncbi:hypothetical protein DB347_20305 [Opitutaceae bacterium EW11]|nr:hypothetical protein DB347_20305 [Opitutaceae bacterium EW11]